MLWGSWVPRSLVWEQMGHVPRREVSGAKYWASPGLSGLSVLIFEKAMAPPYLPYLQMQVFSEK